MALDREFHVRHLAAHEFPARINLPVSTTDGGWLVSFRDQPEVVLLDSGLNELERLDLQAQSQEYCDTHVALNSDGKLFALSGRTELRIADRQGRILHRFPHPPWYAFTGSTCFFDHEGRLWYVRPSDDPLKARLTIIEPYSGAVLFEQTFEADGGHHELFQCPNREGVLIGTLMGQDGAGIYHAQLTGDGLTVHEYEYGDRMFTGGFAPGGREFVTGAHGGDAVRVHSFPDGRTVASLEREEIFSEDPLVAEIEDGVGLDALFLDNEYILAGTEYRRLLLIHRPEMRLLGSVWPEGYHLEPSSDVRGTEATVANYEGSLTSFHPAGSGRLLVVYEARTLALLDTSPLFSSSPGEHE